MLAFFGYFKTAFLGFVRELCNLLVNFSDLLHV